MLSGCGNSAKVEGSTAHICGISHIWRRNVPKPDRPDRRERRSIPNSQMLQELAAASSKSEQEVSDSYVREYEAVGGEGDPWVMSDHPRRYD